MELMALKAVITKDIMCKTGRDLLYFMMANFQIGIK